MLWLKLLYFSKSGPKMNSPALGQSWHGALSQLTPKLKVWLGHNISAIAMGLLPDTQNCRLRMHRECRERFPRHRLQRKPLISDPSMLHGTCVTHVPWCMSGSLIRGGGENVPGISGACATHSFAHLVRGPWWRPRFAPWGCHAI